MPKTRTPQRSPARVELLEGRTLLAWGAFPQLIDQDLAVSKYPQYNGAGQTIAVIDTGIAYNHPAIKGKYAGGVDLVTGDGDPYDEDGHGTGLAAIMVGNSYTFNGATYQGIATGARVLSVRVDNDKNVTDAKYEQAFQWVIANRVKYNITVVNAAFGSGHYTSDVSRHGTRQSRGSREFHFCNRRWSALRVGKRGRRHPGVGCNE